MPNKGCHNDVQFQKFLQQFGDSYDISLLNERSQRFLQHESAAKQHEEEIIRFRLGSTETYAISYQYVEEILSPNQITRIPCVPDYIAGVVNRRSQLLAVYDLKSLFTLDSSKEEVDKIWVIVVSCDEIDYSVCILADEIFGNESYVIEKLAPPLKSAGVKKLGYVKGIIDGNTTLLDIPAILTDDDLRVSQRSI